MRNARAALSSLASDIGLFAGQQADPLLNAPLNAFRERALRIEDQLRQLDVEALGPSPASSAKQASWQQVRAGVPTGRAASPALSLRYGSRSSGSGAFPRKAVGSLLSHRVSVAEIFGTENRVPSAEEFQPRWCVLRDTVLEIFIDEMETTPRTTLSLASATVNVPERAASEVTFCVECWAAQMDANGVDVVEQRQAIWCIVENREMLREWLHCLQKAKRELCHSAAMRVSSALLSDEEDSPFTSIVSQLLDSPPPVEPPPPPPPFSSLAAISMPDHDAHTPTTPQEQHLPGETHSAPLPNPLSMSDPSFDISQMSTSPPSLSLLGPAMTTSTPTLVPRAQSPSLAHSTSSPDVAPTSAHEPTSPSGSAIGTGGAGSVLTLRFFQRNNHKKVQSQDLSSKDGTAPPLRSSKESSSALPEVIVNKPKREGTNLWQRIVKRDGPAEMHIVRTSPPADSGFGTSPSSPYSLLDSNGVAAPPLSEAERRERQVKSVVTELLTTETEHVWSLRLAVKHYLRGVSDLIRHDELKWLTGPLERLVGMENEFYAKLQGITGDLAQVFTSSIEMLRSAYVPYCVHYDEATALLRQFRLRSDVGKRLAELQRSPECRQLDLEDLLIKPPQRLCRYPLLLKELLRALPPDSPAVPHVEKAIQVMDALLHAANETKRQSETIHLLVQLKELIHWPPNLDFEVSPHRQLLRRAAFARITMSKEPATPFKGSLLLFTDCLLVLEQRKAGRQREDHAREVMHLRDCAVLDVAKSTVFTVVRTILPGGRVVIMTASKEEKDEWVNVLTAQVTTQTAPMSPRGTSPR